ncbi:unnamed protein product [Phytophthora lilii]|uniref:Unnamed protein product n=1 Tax=Phytophthora lilii TaxID=2077276 RepID=A0A9W6XFL0_9STRA|nr:unnamed protein product [Phytophthora lilii]
MCSLPAVNAAGEANAGMNDSSVSKSIFEWENHSPLGTQMYARSTWYNDVRAIMYAYYYYFYFPVNFGREPAVPHDWTDVIVWIDNPALECWACRTATLTKSTTEIRLIPILGLA